MSKLKILNVFLMQWFFIRICRFMDDNNVQTHWGFLFPVIPLTGWRSNYIPSNYKTIKVKKTLSEQAGELL